MSSFFQKVKDGAAKAADKAQQALEVQRLNSQISSVRKDIEKVKLEIGNAVLEAYLQGTISAAEPYLIAHSQKIVKHEAIIMQLEQKVQEVKGGPLPVEEIKE
ncbi:hypothetical protein D3C73_443960 [compost metagenome]